MTVRPINDPMYEYTCDLCAKTETAGWIPPNWEGMSIALYGGGMAQMHVCQNCLSSHTIVVLVNKVKTSEIELVDYDV